MIVRWIIVLVPPAAVALTLAWDAVRWALDKRRKWKASLPQILPWDGVRRDMPEE